LGASIRATEHFIRQLRLEDQIKVSASPRTTHSQDGALIYGITGLTAELVAHLVGADGARLGDRPIRTILIPPVLGGSLRCSADGQPAASTYFECSDGVIVLVVASEPLPIHGLNAAYNYAQDSDLQRVDSGWLVNPPALSAVTRSKVGLKTHLRSLEIRTPASTCLDLSTGTDVLRGQLSAFVEAHGSEGGFVIKPDGGSLGLGVRLFGASQIDEAMIFIDQVSANEGSLLVEQRILPSVLSINGHRVDWNLRVLCTLGPEPEIILSSVRYKALGSGPVNWAQGAYGADLSQFSEQYEVSTEAIHETASAAAGLVRSLYLDEFGHSPCGYVGIDCIHDVSGEVHVLEVNGGAVSGVMVHTATAGTTATEVRDVMMAYLGPFLARNADRVAPSLDYRSTPPGISEVVCAVVMLQQGGAPEWAVQLTDQTMQDQGESGPLLFAAARALDRAESPLTEDDTGRRMALHRRALELGHLASYPFVRALYAEQSTVEAWRDFLGARLPEMPLAAEAWVDMGRLLLDAAEFDAAARHLRVAIALGRDSTVVYACLAQAMLASPDLERGQAVLSGMRQNDIDISLNMLKLYCHLAAVQP